MPPHAILILGLKPTKDENFDQFRVFNKVSPIRADRAGMGWHGLPSVCTGTAEPSAITQNAMPPCFVKKNQKIFFKKQTQI